MSKQEQVDPTSDLKPKHALFDSEHLKEIELKEQPILEAGDENVTKGQTTEDLTGDQAEADKTRKDINSSSEKQEQKKIKNTAEFLEVLEDKILQCEDGKDDEKKMKLSFHLIKIKGALRQAGLKPEKLSLMGLSSDELTDYDRTENKLKVRGDILDDLEKNQQFLATIFSEVQIEKKGIRDIGFQLLTIKKKMSINKEIGKKEKQATERTFDEMGISKALDMYDFKNPKELADYFLEKEVEKRRGKINFLNYFTVANTLSQLFKKGAPKLYDELRKKKYPWRSKVKELVKNFPKK
jgi:hypothetical protein